MKRLIFALCLIAVPAYAADVPPAKPQIQPTDRFDVNLPASAWDELIQATDSKSLSAEINRQIMEEWNKTHPQKK